MKKKCQQGFIQIIPMIVLGFSFVSTLALLVMFSKNQDIRSRASEDGPYAGSTARVIPSNTPIPCVGEGGIVASGTGSCCAPLVNSDCVAAGSSSHCTCRPKAATTPSPPTKSCTVRSCSGLLCISTIKTIASSATCTPSTCATDANCAAQTKTCTVKSCSGLLCISTTKTIASTATCTPSTCATDANCVAHACDGKPEGTQVCNTSGGYNYCKAGTWYGKACATGTTCSGGNCVTKALTCDGKPEGAQVCNTSGGYNYCKAGVWYGKACATGTTCSGGNCVAKTLKGNGEKCNSGSDCTSGNCYAGNQTLGGSPFDSTLTCHANSIVTMDKTTQQLAERSAAGYAVIATIPVVATYALPAYVYGSAALTTAPAAVQTAISIGTTAVGWGVVAAGTAECAKNPGSQACLAYVASLQGDPTQLAQLAGSTDTLINNFINKQLNSSFSYSAGAFGPTSSGEYGQLVDDLYTNPAPGTIVKQMKGEVYSPAAESTAQKAYQYISQGDDAATAIAKASNQDLPSYYEGSLSTVPGDKAKSLEQLAACDGLVCRNYAQYSTGVANNMGQSADIASFPMSTPHGTAGHSITVLQNADGGYSVIDATNNIATNSIDEYMQIIGGYGWTPTSNIQSGINGWNIFSVSP